MRQKPFLTGNKIKLRKLTDADFEKFKEIEGNMENRLLMEDDIPFPPTDENHRSFIDQISANKEEYTFAIEKLERNLSAPLVCFVSIGRMVPVMLG